MIRTILIGLGGTPFTNVAIERAVELARIHQAIITGVTVFNPEAIQRVGPVPVGGGAYAQRMRDRRRKVTEETVAEAIERFHSRCRTGGIPARVEQEKGDPFTLMAKRARFSDVTIFGLRSLFDYGITSEPKAALINLVAQGVRPIIAVSERFRPIRKALIAFNGTMSAAKALRRFVQLNPWPGTAVEIVHFTPSPTEEDRRDLVEASEYCQAHGFTVDTVVRSEDPRDGLLAYAQETKADLIVMGNGMRRLMVRKVLGDTVLDTIQKADRPLFLTQ
ncbi:MAG: universal stress protein [Desulfosarcinaceae bacterium]|nr:universal stress protein [Desulfosarcinaceae bacterium]